MKQNKEYIKYLNTLGSDVSVIEKEKQNAAYFGCVAQVDSKLHRIRVAKITPKKLGQFVAIWEKDESGCNVAFKSEISPNYLTIFCFDGINKGIFIFPKSLLEEKGIYQSLEKKGKMAFRVYPSWDIPSSKKALETQKWQLDFFHLIKNKSA